MYSVGIPSVAFRDGVTGSRFLVGNKWGKRGLCAQSRTYVRCCVASGREGIVGRRRRVRSAGRLLTCRSSCRFLRFRAPLGARHFGLRKHGFHDCVGLRKALSSLNAVSQMRDGRVGDYRRGSPRYSHNAGSAGLVNGTGYPASKCGVDFFFLVAEFGESFPSTKGV